jgi:hypothetical protein
MFRMHEYYTHNKCSVVLVTVMVAEFWFIVTKHSFSLSVSGIVMRGNVVKMVMKLQDKVKLLMYLLN